MPNLKFVEKPSQIDDVKVVSSYRDALIELKQGNPCCMFENGISMFPILFDREYCKLTPVEKPSEEIKVGDGVLCSVNGSMMIHRVTDIVHTENKGIWFQIGSTYGYIFGWTDERSVYAKASETGYVEKI